MPDYKVEIKSAIYKDGLDAKQVQSFNEMMQLLKDKTPEEYIIDIDKKLLEAYSLQEKQNSKYEESLNRIETNYKNGIKVYADMTRDKSNYLGSPANYMHLCLESMDSLEDMWEDKFKGKENDISGGGLKKVWKDIQEEIAKAKENGDFGYYNSTKTYKSLNIGEKNMVDRYFSFATEIDKYISDPNPEIKSKLSAVEENIKEYNFYKDQYKDMKKDALDSNPEKEKLDAISAIVSSLSKKKENMQNFMDGQYKDMQTVNTAGLSEVSKKNALDMLAEARREYKNNCNWWDRIWANILPSHMFSKSAYVDKINAYKEVLKEGGASEKEIENADPEKSKDYVYNKSTKKYLKVIKSEAVADNKEPSNDMSLDSSKSSEFNFEIPSTINESVVPAKKNADVQKTFQENLGEATGDGTKTNTEDLSKPKTNNVPQVKQDLGKNN